MKSELQPLKKIPRGFRSGGFLMIPISEKLVYTPFSVIIYYIPSGVRYSGGAKNSESIGLINSLS
jgi:hypothetical protein